MAMRKKVAGFAWALAFVMFVSSPACSRKSPSSPDIDDIINPKIWISVTAMSFAAAESGENPNSQVLQVKNSGGGTLNYNISDNADWLSIIPSSGSSTGNVIEHTVSVDISGLTENTYSGTISITSSTATNSPQSVNVSLAVSSPLAENKISISCDPTSGGTGTTVTIPVVIEGNIREIGAFGLELTYDTNMFEFKSVIKGDKTENWASVDGNEVSSGIIRVGGFAGSAAPISRGNIGSIVKIILEVTCSSCSNGQQSQLCIQSYTDDIADMTPKPSCATFTYNE